MLPHCPSVTKVLSCRHTGSKLLYIVLIIYIELHLYYKFKTTIQAIVFCHQTNWSVYEFTENLIYVIRSLEVGCKKCPSVTQLLNWLFLYFLHACKIMYILNCSQICKLNHITNHFQQSTYLFIDYSIQKIQIPSIYVYGFHVMCNMRCSIDILYSRHKLHLYSTTCPFRMRDITYENTSI